MVGYDLKNLLNKKFQIFGGRIGSGKTEIAVNIAIALKLQNIDNTLFDMDIVKPYVRIRDIREKIGIYDLSIVSPPDITRTLDLPIFPPFIISRLMENETIKILDVGGDPYGAGSLAQFKNIIEKSSYNFFFVVNTRRPETSTEDEIISSLKEVEQASRLKVTHFILNTNLRWETTRDIFMKGKTILENVSEKTGIPIEFGCVAKNYKELADGVNIPILPLKLFIEPLPNLNNQGNGLKK